MLDREAVGEFLHDELEEVGIEVPKDIRKGSLVETFCQYVEEDYYEWLRDNFESFFDHGDPDWGRIREKVRRVE